MQTTPPSLVPLCRQRHKLPLVPLTEIHSRSRTITHYSTVLEARTRSTMLTTGKTLTNSPNENANTSYLCPSLNTIWSTITKWSELCSGHTRNPTLFISIYRDSPLFIDLIFNDTCLCFNRFISTIYPDVFEYICCGHCVLHFIYCCFIWLFSCFV